jgi:hypothetical protein
VGTEHTSVAPAEGVVGQSGGVEWTRNPRGDVAATLSYDEAFVLFELLHRWEDQRVYESAQVEDQAEQRVLWDLTASLEPLIDEVFSADYSEVLERCRSAVRDPVD